MADTGKPASNKVLSVRKLTVDFLDLEGALHAVRGVDLTLSRGECLGIVGESGSGKSVTAAAIMGLLGKDAKVGGAILLGEQNLLSLSYEQLRSIRGKRLSMIFQEPSRSFDPIYSMGKTFEETFKTKNPKISPEETRTNAIRLLSEVHIPHAEDRLKNFPHQFSGGMLQRIMIALALANDPDILIADEPTTALDVTIQAQIVSLLKELQQKRQLSVIFISHDLGLVGQIADRILVMYGGLVLETGTVENVLRRPHSPYTRALLNALPAWGSHHSQSRLYTISGNVPDPTHPEPGCPFEPRCPMSQPVCSTAVPPLLRADDAGGYRCVIPGAKE